MIMKDVWQQIQANPVLSQVAHLAKDAAAVDPAHDFSHSLRVLANALKIAAIEGGDFEILTAAAFLHDIANLPKSHPDSSKSSEYSASKAEELLLKFGFSTKKIPALKDAVLCHSYSRGLTPQTLEGRVFQDADRLDSLGAIGIARTFAVGGATARPLYDLNDPFLETDRLANDKQNTLDHFYKKLFKIGDLMLTPTGRRLARDRTETMKSFLGQLRQEIL